MTTTNSCVNRARKDDMSRALGEIECREPFNRRNPRKFAMPADQTQTVTGSPRPVTPLWNRLLVVNDNPMDLRAAEQVLGSWSREVDLATNGLKAVSVVAGSLKQGTPFDAVILDYQMPGMDGPATARLLRASGYRGPILAISANNSETAKANAHKSGCAAFLYKPIPWPELITILQVLTKRTDSLPQS